MAINFIIIDFDKPVSDEPQDILNYLGYIPDVAGKPDIECVPHLWDLNFGFDFPIWGKMFRLLIADVDVPYLTIVMQHAIPLDRREDVEFVKTRTSQFAEIVKWLYERFDYKVKPEDVDCFEAIEGTVGYQFNVDLTDMVKDLADSRRNSFKAVK